MSLGHWVSLEASGTVWLACEREQAIYTHILILYLYTHIPSHVHVERFSVQSYPGQFRHLWSYDVQACIIQCRTYYEA
jgi:hypothetical protein